MVFKNGFSTIESYLTFQFHTGTQSKGEGDQQNEYKGIVVNILFHLDSSEKFYYWTFAFCFDHLFYSSICFFIPFRRQKEYKVKEMIWEESEEET